MKVNVQAALSDHIRMRGRGQSISLVVADDHPVVLHGILSILHAHPDLEVLATCADGIRTAEAIRRYRPDIAVLDIAMPGLNGLEVLASISSSELHSKIVFLTATATDRQILAAVEGGAMGLLLKESAADELVSCIRAIAAGERRLAPSLVEPARRREEARQANSDRLKRLLSTREREVMMLVAEGLPNKEIGRLLSLSGGTVKVHLYNMYQKLGTKNRTALTNLALSCQEPNLYATQRKDS